MIENVQKPTPEATNAASGGLPAPTCESGGNGSLMLLLGGILIIVLLNLAAFHGSLRGYFLADDFAHVDYLKSVFNGNAHLLAKNFYSNWMQTLGTSFYRPWISITLAGDYLLYGANPNGFHVSNFFYQTLSSVFLFLSLNSMFPVLEKKIRLLTALLAAGLFACHPLHPEVVSWIIARVDSVCTTFLFLSLWLYLLASNEQAKNETAAPVAGKTRAGVFQILSLISFALSLMSKEMAITLPPTIFLYEIVNSSLTQKSWQEKFTGAFKACKWHIAMLLLYIGLRAIVLGTLVGGYTGSVGEGLKGSVFKRWFQEGCLLRLILPFNDDVTPARHPIRLIFKLMTVGAIGLAFLRVASKSNKQKPWPLAVSPYLVFALGWILIALAPTIQVFDITANLQGGRFVYLATAPLVLIIAALVFGCGDRQNKHGNLGLVSALSFALAGLFLVSYTWLAAQNNKPWQEASNGVRNLRAGVEKALEGQPPAAKIALLNLPPHNKGAHMLYNAAMFGVTLKPPLSKTDLTQRVYTFEPVTFGDANLFNRNRYQDLLADKDLAGVFVWDSAQQRLLPLMSWQKRSGAENGGRSSPPVVDLQPGSGVLEGSKVLNSPVFDVSSADFDFIDLELKAEPSDAKPIGSDAILVMYWSGATHPMFDSLHQIAVPIKQPGQFEKYRFSVGELKTWVSEDRITGLRLDTSNKPMRLSLKSARVIDAKDEIPSLSISPQCKSHIDSNGTIYTSEELGPIVYDAGKIKNAKSVRYEISSPDSWFEHYTGTLRDQAPSEHISTSGQFDQLQSSSTLVHLDALSAHGFYEFRIMALDAAGKPLGYVSNPINFQFGGSAAKGKKGRK